MTDKAMAFVGATLIDGTGAPAMKNAAIVVQGDQFAWIGPRDGLDPAIDVTDVSGKYVIPGLLDANVHLLSAVEPEFLLAYVPGQYDDLILEAAQVSLRAGITTVFDTWGPLPSLRRVRDRIHAGGVIGSRIFFGGNIIGTGGPWSDDFPPRALGDISAELVNRVNQEWEQGVGQDLLRLPADDVRPRVREYIRSSGIDFVKYSSSCHGKPHLIAFSPDAQRIIVEEAHAAGLIAQACTIAPEALSIAISAGVDLLQHADITGSHPMPDATLERIVTRQLPSTAFLETEAHLASLVAADPGEYYRQLLAVKDENDRRLIKSGAKILLAHDMGIYPPGSAAQQMMAASMDPPGNLGTSHVYWLKAAIERGMSPMEALMAATRNIAEAYGKIDEIGTVEAGKRADCVILDVDPLEDVVNYWRVDSVMKDGDIVDRGRLPEKPVLTRLFQGGDGVAAAYG